MGRGGGGGWYVISLVCSSLWCSDLTILPATYTCSCAEAIWDLFIHILRYDIILLNYISPCCFGNRMRQIAIGGSHL